MRISNRILKFYEGGAAPDWADNAVDDEGYATNLVNTPLTYGDDVQWGTEFNENLPVITDDLQGYFSIGKNAQNQQECVAGINSFQCQATSSRRFAGTLGGTQGYGSAAEILANLQPNLKTIMSALEGEGISNEFIGYQSGLKDEEGNFIKPKYSKLQFPESGASVEEQAKIYQGRFGAWHLKSMLLNNGKGSLLWEKPKGGEFNYSDLDSIKKEFQVGDFVTLTRKSGGNPYDQHKIPSYESEEGVTHVGLIVGQTSDGVPIIEHSWTQNGEHKTKRERLDKLKGHIPSSIIRYNNINNSNKPNLVGDTNKLNNSTVTIGLSPNTIQRLTQIEVPAAQLNSIGAVKDWMTELGSLRSRLQGASIYDSQGKDFVLYDLSSMGLSGNDFITADTSMWQSKANKLLEEAELAKTAKADRKSERKANRPRLFKKREKKVKIQKSGGLIYHG